MLEFVFDNLLLVLTLSGAVVSFLVTLISLISKKKPVAVLAVLAAIGFAVGIAYQLSAHSKKQEDERRSVAKAQIEEAATKARDNIIKEINVTVGETKITVDSIAGKLRDMTLQQTTAEMVSITTDDSADFDATTAFAKGSPEMWQHYAGWLSSLEAEDSEPSLSLTIDGTHHYDAGLLLAYILTSSATNSRLKDVVRRHSAWHSFEAESLFLDAFSPNVQHIKWVLFFDGTNQVPVAYADAKLFAQELMTYHRLERHQEVGRLLNMSGNDAVDTLAGSFSSIITDVSVGTNPSELVRLMIERQNPIAIAASGDKTYVARLERMIRIATR